MLAINKADLEKIEEALTQALLGYVEPIAEAQAACARVREFVALPELIDEAREIARDVEDEEDRISFDDEASTSPSDDGTFVSCWFWVPNDPADEEEDEGGELPAVPEDFPVKVIPNAEAQQRAVDGECIATCEGCGRSWDDSQPTNYTPAPSGRCPFEAFHA